MPLISKFRLTTVTLPCLLALCGVSVVGASMDPRFEIDPQALAVSEAVSRPSAKKNVRSVKSRPARRMPLDTESTYVVKPGDHLFKILMHEYGLSNSQAKALIEKVKRDNDISDIRRLKIGQKIAIPRLRQSPSEIRRSQALDVASTAPDSTETTVGQSFVLESPVDSPPSISAQESLDKVRDVWNKVVPAKANLQKPLVMQTSTFSLTLDPQRYPTFSTMDGARILLDQNNSIPPLVKSLIEEKDPNVRIVSESPAGSRQFMSSMLKAAGFYSVEENFSMDFGTDPRLTVMADFKIEKTPESLVKQDIVLLNSGRIALPTALNAFLKKEGFALYEPFASLKKLAVGDARTLHVVKANSQPEMVDAILSAFSVNAVNDRSLDVFAADNNGISLAVKAERYFERNGQSFVVTRFDGDPVNYTLFRILETKGYRVVILEAQDGFRKVAEKIISRMKIQGHFAKHRLLQDDSAGYSLQMSGFKFDDGSLPGGELFLTDHAMDRIISDLLTENGYRINSR